MEKRRLAVGPLGDFPVGKFRIVSIDGVEIGIVRLAGGALHAVRNRCPHKGAPVCKGILGGTWPPSAVGELAFERDGEVLVCPWHGYEYDIKTGECVGDRRLRLRKYDVVRRGDDIYVVA